MFGKNPRILVNLTTLSYHFESNMKDLLCGYQINKIKLDFETFLKKLEMAGAELQFVFKKVVAEDKEFLKRRLRDHEISCQIIENIEMMESFTELEQICKIRDSLPYNPLILVAIIQSAEKFGKVHGCHIIRGKPAMQQIQLMNQEEIDFILGLDTFYFLFPGNFKVWSDVKLCMDEMRVQQLEPQIIFDHFKLDQKDIPLFACLIGDLQSKYSKKVLNHFGMKPFVSAAKFINRMSESTPEEKLQIAIDKIFGNDPNKGHIFDDFNNSIKSFEVLDPPDFDLEPELVDIIKNEFISFAEEIVYNTPIFINPVFSDFRKTDMKTLPELVMPPIQRTCGLLLVHEDAPGARHVVMVENIAEDFVKVPIVLIKPPFEVPDMKAIIGGSLSTYEKLDILFWIMGLDISKHDLVVIPEEYVGDCIILLYLLKNESLKLIDARCILKTLVDTRRNSDQPMVSTEYPDKVDGRAFRCGYLFTKMYFIIHSCLASIGLKYLCPEVQFDGVYFQKIYALNVDEEQSSEKSDPQEVNDHLLAFDVLIDIFANVIRM
jgi:hypothetical protein